MVEMQGWFDDRVIGESSKKTVGGAWWSVIGAYTRAGLDDTDLKKF